MKRIKKSEIFKLEFPTGAEPNELNQIERIEYEDGKIVWFGNSTNWKKEPNENWTFLTENPNAKPLEKYLPDIVYGGDRTYFKECEIPIYEKIYQQKYNT